MAGARLQLQDRLGSGDRTSMTTDSTRARNVSTAELEAMTVLQDIREHGGYVLLDLQGTLHVRHIARVPPELRNRLVRCDTEIARLLLQSVE
jgi:hypothetical protein